MKLLVLTLFALGSAAHADVCSRTGAVRDALTQQIGKTCDQVTGQDLLSVTDLVISGEDRRVEGLRAGDFDGLSRMKALSIVETYVTELDPGVFRDLPALHSLSLGRNELAAVPREAIRSLSGLVELVLSGNPIRTLAADDLDGLTSLERLFLEETTLGEIEDGAFSKLHVLRQLHLRDTHLHQISPNVFDAAHFSPFAHVFLEDNQINEASVKMLKRQLKNRVWF